MQITLTNISHNSANIDESYPYVTTICFKNNSQVTGIIDNVYGKTLCMYLIDPKIQGDYFDSIIQIAEQWYNNDFVNPISVTFEQAGIKQYAAPLCKMYSLSNITGIDGPVFSFYDKPVLIKKQQIRVEK